MPDPYPLILLGQEPENNAEHQENQSESRKNKFDRYI
jgi:hypothetical protein